MNAKHEPPPEATRPSHDVPPVQPEDPAADRAAQKARKQPAQVKPEDKKAAERHPEDVPAPGDMGPPEGPGA